MTLTFYSDASLFLNDHQAQLCKEESRYNLILGLAIRAAEKQNPISAWAHLSTGALALRTSDKTPLLLTELLPEEIPLWVDMLKPLRFQELLAPKGTAEAVLSELPQGQHARVKMRQGIYEARQIMAPEHPEGFLRLAKGQDQALVGQWINAFIWDCFSNQLPQADTDAMAHRLITEERMHLYICKDQPVSMVCNNRQTPNTATVSYVYTPNDMRGKGYGSCATAALSQLLLNRGFQACNLHTNLDNPTSNAIYTKLGYKQLAQSLLYQLEDL